jgi:hypothetical protein
MFTHVYIPRLDLYETDQLAKSVYNMEIYVWETSTGMCCKNILMFSQLKRAEATYVGVAGEEEGSVGGPTHILQAAENSCRTSLC